MMAQELAALVRSRGYDDPDVRGAVQGYQAVYGLPATGVYDPRTRGTLLAHGAPDAPPAFYRPSGKATTVAAAPAALVANDNASGLLMKPSVLQIFRTFSTKFEGYLPYMYLDIKGLVTTGMGNLIDPIGAALGLPWKRPDGTLASQDEVRAAWNLVKSRIDLAPKYGTAFAGLTTIRLDKAGIEQLIAKRLKANEDLLRRRFPGYLGWPADAQLGLHSMSWAMGAGFHFPAFEEAVNRERPDFHAAAIASHMDDRHNPGLVPRNKANFELFTNAAHVLERGADPAALYWPGDVIAAVEREVKKVGLGPALGVGLALGAVALAAGLAAHARARRIDAAGGERSR